MKIVLTRPNYHSHLITPQLALGYLSAYLRKHGYKTEIVDGLNEGLSTKEIVRRCHDADIVGISCLSDYFLLVKDLSLALKELKKIVVIGGPHASALPEFTLNETGADYVVIGEGEDSILEIIRHLEAGQKTFDLPGVFTRESKKITKRNFIENLDDIPFPDWELMPPNKYKKAPHGGLIKKFPVAPIVSTRGCPYECSFCASPKLWDRKIRLRSPENVVDEIKYLVNNFGVREIHFEDDNLTLKRAHIENVCRLIIDAGLKIYWSCPNGVRADTLDDELLKLMKKSGCYSLAFGIESGNQHILENVNKKINLETIKNAVIMAKKTGIMTQGFFIFGLPGETRNSVENTIKFAKSIPIDKAQFLLLDLLPGSQLWDEVGDGKKFHWDARSYQETTWVPETIDRKFLERTPSIAFLKFFLRPKQILNLIKLYKPSQTKFVIRRLLDFGILPGRKN